jgi:4,4'-diaponeurosporenoate glycosyltransferase
MIPVIALGLWILGFVILCRIPRCRSGAPARERPLLSVIVPARNEEESLPRLLDSLRRQEPPPDEILVVDDGSADGTAAVARAAGARVVPSAPLPGGWRGKTWACHQGAAAARGEVLLFVDADTWFEPGGLARAYGTWLRQGGVLSVGAYHSVVRAYEELSAYFNLMMNIGIGAFTALGTAVRPAGLFGPFLMLDRKTYAQGGGHAAVRSRILENYFMAGIFRRLGVPLHCRGGRGVFHMRMYPHGFRDMVDGWSKAFAAGAASTPKAILLLASGWLAGNVLAAIGIARAACGAEPMPALGIGVYLLYAGQLGWMLRQIGSFRPWTSLLYPVPLIFYLVVFTRSAIRAGLGRQVAWKGRAISAEREEERADHVG